MMPGHRAKKMMPMKDTDRMAFGKFKDVPIKDVPAWWLHWIWNAGKKNEVATCPLADYISKNMAALQQENTDKIWDDAKK